MILAVELLHVRYGSIAAVSGISFEARQGSIVTMLGANGAGKTTTLRAISGLLRPASGRIMFDGTDIAGRAPHTIVAAGIAHAPEGRMIFSNLSVMENLRMGAYLRTDADEIAHDLEFVFSVFPRLKERVSQSGGTLSGGEQQMLAISRALMARPKLLLLDEPSLGIAPILVKSIFEKIVEINRTREITIVLVEQNAHLALAIADDAYVLETGRIVIHGPAKEVAADENVRKAYLGEG